MPFNIDAMSSEKQQGGIWADLDGSKFLIASTDSFTFQREFSRLQRPFKKKIDKETLDPKQSLDLLCEALSKTILIDWKNVVDGQGKKVPYSQEAAKQALLTNSDFRSWVQEVALDSDGFKAEIEEEEVKS